MKRLYHPDHGFTHVYNPTEETWHRSRGWVDESHAPKKKGVAPIPVAEVIEEVEIPTMGEPAEIPASPKGWKKR
jgi:hypothetical protein